MNRHAVARFNEALLTAATRCQKFKLIWQFWTKVPRPDKNNWNNRDAFLWWCWWSGLSPEVIIWFSIRKLIGPFLQGGFLTGSAGLEILHIYIESGVYQERVASYFMASREIMSHWLKPATDGTFGCWCFQATCNHPFILQLQFNYYWCGTLSLVRNWKWQVHQLERSVLNRKT